MEPSLEERVENGEQAEPIEAAREPGPLMPPLPAPSTHEEHPSLHKYILEAAGEGYIDGYRPPERYRADEHPLRAKPFTLSPTTSFGMGGVGVLGSYRLGTASGRYNLEAHQHAWPGELGRTELHEFVHYELWRTVGHHTEGDARRALARYDPYTPDLAGYH